MFQTTNKQQCFEADNRSPLSRNHGIFGENHLRQLPCWKIYRLNLFIDNVPILNCCLFLPDFPRHRFVIDSSYSLLCFTLFIRFRTCSYLAIMSNLSIVNHGQLVPISIMPWLQDSYESGHPVRKIAVQTCSTLNISYQA